jgi:protein arginine kinase activator
MKCTRCGEREGVVNLTEIQGGEVRTGSLCARCAAEKGIETASAAQETPLGGFLAALGEAGGPDAAIAAATATACPACGATLQDFRESGRVGCATCYQTFDTPLRELLRRLHGSAHHSGRRYRRPAPGAPGEPATPPSQPVQELREQLRLAIASEQFELAAELRDRLREQE